MDTGSRLTTSLPDMAFPNGLGIPTVCADFLLNLRQVVEADLLQRLGDVVFEKRKLDIQYVFSAADPWNAEMSARFSAVLHDAGYTNRLQVNHSLKLVSEAEAVLSIAIENGALQLRTIADMGDYSDVFLVVKCGNSGVEICTLEVGMLTPLQFRPYLLAVNDAYGLVTPAP